MLNTNFFLALLLLSVHIILCAVTEADLQMKVSKFQSSNSSQIGGKQSSYKALPRNQRSRQNSDTSLQNNSGNNSQSTERHGRWSSKKSTDIQNSPSKSGPGWSQSNSYIGTKDPLDLHPKDLSIPSLQPNPKISKKSSTIKDNTSARKTTAGNKSSEKQTKGTKNTIKEKVEAKPIKNVPLNSENKSSAQKPISTGKTLNTADNKKTK